APLARIDLDREAVLVWFRPDHPAAPGTATMSDSKTGNARIQPLPAPPRAVTAPAAGTGAEARTSANAGASGSKSTAAAKPSPAAKPTPSPTTHATVPPRESGASASEAAGTPRAERPQT